MSTMSKPLGDVGRDQPVAALVQRARIEKHPRLRCNVYMAPSAKQADWFTSFRNAYAIHNVISWRPELPLFLILWDGKDELEWMELSAPQQPLKPFHFETYYGKEDARDAHYIEALVRTAKQKRKKPLARKLFGFCDLFLSIGAFEGREAFLFAGQFHDQQPTWDTISEQWRALSGQDPASANLDFVQFVRMALSLPVLEGELLETMCRFMVLYGGFLTGKRSDIQERVDELNASHLSRLWPIDNWIMSAISPDKFQLTPWYLEGKLADWMKEGMLIDRLPTTAMAIMPLDNPGQPLDPVETLVRNAEIQRAWIVFARDLRESAATALGDYGVSVITATKKYKNEARRRLELRERAQKFQQFARERFGVRSVAGIGATLAPGAPLHASHEEAVLAMHMCVQLDKSVLFYDEHTNDQQLGYPALNSAAHAMRDALERENATEMKLASDRYVQLVLRYASGRIEVARGQFLAVLCQLFDAVQRHQPMRHDARDRFAEELTSQLEGAQSTYQLLESFNTVLARISFVSSRAWQGPNVMRLEAALQYIRDNFGESLTLQEVARRAGFSVPSFSRVFKKATGTTFLSYLRGVRVEHAKRLLTTTPMTMEQVAQTSGFHSQHHLIRSFRKVTDTTPGAYRKAHASRYGDV